MRRKHLIFDFSQFSAAVLIELVWAILNQMANNPYFTTPSPTLADIKSALQDLIDKDSLAHDGGRQATNAMKISRGKLQVLLYKLTLYIENIADGNETILLSSGVPMWRSPSPAQRPDFILKRSAEPGEITARGKAIPKSRAYSFQIFVGENLPDDEKKWVWMGMATQVRFTFRNLSKGSTVWVRYCGVTKDGMTPWCDPKSIDVL